LKNIEYHHYKQSIALDFHMIQVNKNKKHESDLIKIYDTPGSDSYSILITNNIKVSKYIIMIYDVANQQSFQNLDQYWIDQVIDQDFLKDKNIILLGNIKKDVQNSIHPIDIE